MKMKYVYPAVFTKEQDIYSVTFPDLDIATSGESIAEAVDMAKDALCLMLYDMEEHGVEIPAPSDIKEVSCHEDSFVSLIDCDTMEYRRYFGGKAVKKTLSIPAWLNTLAEREDVNFSSVLQKALKAELGL